MKEILFHQKMRYSFTQKVIEQMRTKKCHKILEVGSGGHALLTHFFPQDDLKLTDIQLPENVLEDDRFEVADATQLPYADQFFDFVIGLDVLEHIPVEKRDAFLREISRVARCGVVLTYPHAHRGADLDDGFLREIYHLMDREPPVWVDEHLECTLPDSVDIAQRLREINPQASVESVYQGNRNTVSTLLQWEVMAGIYPRLVDMYGVLNDRYCEEILDGDYLQNGEDAIKTCVVVSRNGAVKLPEANPKDEQKSAQFGSFALQWLTMAMQLNDGRSAQDSQITMEAYHKENLETIGDFRGALGALLDERWTTLYNILVPSPPKPEPLQVETEMDVLLVCYNQSEYIQQTLQTILDQQVHGFKYRVIVADDASTDDTVEKIRAMAAATDVEFVFLPNDKNHGIMQNYKRSFAACTSRYVAVMEGDDLWTSPDRLQSHYEFLEQHPECVMSFNTYEVRNFKTGASNVQPRLEPSLPFAIFGGGDIAYDNLIGNFSTCVYRLDALRQLPEEMYTWKGFDWITNLMISRQGLIGCLNRVMNIYRIHEKGVWSSQDQAARTRDLIAIIDDYDEKLDYVYHEPFAAHKGRLKKMLLPEWVKKLKRKAQSGFYKCKKLQDLLPPVIVWFVKMLVPPVIVKKLKG